MYKFEIETRTGAVHQYAIIDSYQEITLDKHRQYFKTILPIQPKIKADDDWDADFSDVCEWAVQVCALFSNCSEDMLWELPPFYLLGGKLESGEYFEGLVYKVIQAFDALHDYEQELALNVNNKKSAFNIIKGSFVHKGVEYFLPAKGFDETKMEEFVRLQQLQAFSDKLSNQNEKNKINAKAKKQGKDIQSDEWDIAAAMLAVLAKPKVGGQWVKGYNKKDIAAREEAFKDVPMYLLKDVGFFFAKNCAYYAQKFPFVFKSDGGSQNEGGASRSASKYKWDKTVQDLAKLPIFTSSSPKYSNQIEVVMDTDTKLVLQTLEIEIMDSLD